ncbi:MAG: hypothetical protein LIO46_03820, partial [Clostridiales bacterium]|nr:hypothetical protein [Clostridiales bacterium]
MSVTYTLFVLTFTQSTEQEGTDSLNIGNERGLLSLLVLAALFSFVLLLAVALLVSLERLERQRLLWTIRQRQYEKEEQNRLQV